MAHGPSRGGERKPHRNREEGESTGKGKTEGRGGGEGSVEAYRIGFPETTLGLTVPRYMVAHLAHVVGPGVAERHVREGRLWTACEAKEVGLVDEVCSEAQVLRTAMENILPHTQGCPSAWVRAKCMLRGNLAYQVMNSGMTTLDRAIYVNHFRMHAAEISRRVRNGGEGKL